MADQRIRRPEDHPHASPDVRRGPEIRRPGIAASWVTFALLASALLHSPATRALGLGTGLDGEAETGSSRDPDGEWIDFEAPRLSLDAFGALRWSEAPARRSGSPRPAGGLGLLAGPFPLTPRWDAPPLASPLHAPLGLAPLPVGASAGSGFSLEGPLGLPPFWKWTFIVLGVVAGYALIGWGMSALVDDLIQDAWDDGL
jgi:hypothetical protein